MCSEGAQAFGYRPTYAKPHWVANWPTMVRMRKTGLLNEQQPHTYNTLILVSKAHVRPVHIECHNIMFISFD